MDIRAILKESWTGYKQHFLKLILITSPYIILAAIIGVITKGELDTSGKIFYMLGFLVLEALITLQGLRYLYKNDGIELEINTKKIILFMFASIYVAVAVMLGLILVIIPGIIVMTVTMLMPLYILKESQGPIEAVSSSVRLIKPFLLRVMFLAFSMWIILLLINAFIEGVLQLLYPEMISGILSSLISYIIGLFYLVVIKNLYEDLKKTQGILPENQTAN